MTNSDIIKQFDLLRDKLYAEQPSTMDTIEALIDLVQCALCDHEYDTKRTPDTPDEPSEMVSVCKKCGAEQDD